MPRAGGSVTGVVRFVQDVVFAGETDGWRWVAGLVLVASACTREPVSSVTASTSTGAGMGTSSTGADATSEVETSSGVVPMDVGMPCDATLQPGPLTLLTDVATGAITPFDMDGDDAIDAVGEHGTIVLHTEEVRPSDIAPSTLVPGRFVQGALADFLVRTPGEPARIFPDVFGPAQSKPYLTGVPYGAVAVGDLEGDGLDDLVAAEGELVRVWRNPDAYAFVADDAVDAEYEVWSVAFISRGAPGLTHVAALGAGGLTVFEITENGLGEGELLETSAVYWVWAADFRGTGELGIGFVHEGGTLANINSGVGVAYFADGEWTSASHDLDGASTGGVAFADLDGDVDLDIAVSVGGDRIDLACLSDVGYTLCGRMTIGMGADGLAVLEDPLRLVISNEDGTWLMPLPSPVCN
jgi:hypothetical protein